MSLGLNETSLGCESGVKNSLRVIIGSSNTGDRPPLLLIHGWSWTSSIWQSVAQPLAEKFDLYYLDFPGSGINQEVVLDTIDELLEAYREDVAPHLPFRYSILGWSLGGVLASLLAERYSEKIDSLILVSTSPQFVNSESWRVGMNDRAFAAFSNKLRDAAATTIARFRALQVQGAPSAREDLRIIKEFSESNYDVKALERGLQWLRETTLYECWSNLLVPTQLQYGRHDVLVPIALAENESSFPNKSLVEIFETSAHLPFISERQGWLNSVIEFVKEHAKSNSHLCVADIEHENHEKCSNVEKIDKFSVARAFSRAASIYDERALFQHEVGERLLNRLHSNIELHSNVLDLGSGTGFFNEKTSIERPDLLIYELDIAAGMLQQSIKKSSNAYQLQADFDLLPFKHESFNAVFSNLSVQWSEDFGALKSVYEVLSKGGHFVFSTILAGSLLEIKRAWAEVDADVHTHAFVDESSLLSEINECGFEVVDIDIAYMREQFVSVKELISSVNGIGAGNHLRARSRSTLSKSRYQKFVRALAHQQTTDGFFPLSYRICCVVLRK